MVELRFHYLIVANINLIKAITESFKKKSVVLVVFPAIQLTPVCTHLKKNVCLFFFFAVFVLFQITSTLLKLACQHLKESMKNVIFLEYQKSWGLRVETF